MNSPLILIPPIINVLVTALFAGVVLSQYIRKHRPYQLYWSIALGMAFFASLAYVVMLFVGPTTLPGTVFFRFYYVLGAALMPAWLGLGSIALVSNGTVTRICLTILYLLSVFATFTIFLATINMNHLSHIAGTPGTGTIEPGIWLVAIIILNTLGVIAVVGVALYSGFTLLRKQSSVAGLRASNLWWANVMIVAGDLLNAAAGTLARVLGLQSTFWLIMAVGWSIFFYGVLLAGKRAHPTTTSTTPSTSVASEKQLASS